MVVGVVAVATTRQLEKELASKLHIPESLEKRAMGRKSGLWYRYTCVWWHVPAAIGNNFSWQLVCKEGTNEAVIY